MGLTRLAISRPVVLLMALLAIMVLGWRARMEMPAEMDPRVDIPVVNVLTVYPGAGPAEVEQRVSRPLEDAVSSVGNVTEVASRSLENLSIVTVDFKLGTDLNAAAADIRARIESVRRDLPEEIEPPQVSKVDFNARPVLVLGVTGEGSLQETRALVDEQIKPRLSQVPGLGGVTVVGGLQREVRIRVDPERLALYGLSLLDLLRPLQASSRSAPAGTVVEGQRDVAVRVLGEFGSLEDIRNTPIPVDRPPMMLMADPRAGGAGGARGPAPAPSAPLRLGDIATITDDVEQRTQITRVGGRESVSLILSRLSNANTVEVAEGVKRELERLKERLPGHIRVTVIQDYSQTVADALEDINATLILGALLAVLVVYIFLHSLKDTLIVACAIPTSIIGTFIVMYFAGFSLNQMTMLALSLSVGILVDDSILVLECIHRHRAMGKSPEEAALDGRQEIGLADAANTFVDVIVFLPIAFMGGIVGQFFRQFGLTIATATLASLYISFSVTPMLAAHWFRRGEEPVRGPFARWFDARYEVVERFYRRLLGWALRHRPAVVLAGFGSLIGVGFLAWQVVGFDFTPSIDRGQVSVRVELPPGSSVQATDRVLAQVEQEATRIPEVEAERILTTVGEIVGGFGSMPDRGPQLGQVTLMLREKQGFLDRLFHPGGEAGKRTRSDQQVAAELRNRLRQVPGAQSMTVLAVRGLTSALAPLQIGLYGEDLAELERVSEEVKARLAAQPMLRDVDTSLRRGRPELQVVLDRERAEEVFVTPAELTGVVRTAVAGNTDLRYREGERTYPIRLDVGKAGKPGGEPDAAALQELIVARRGATPVYVADVADIRAGVGPTKILRSNRSRRVIVMAHVREGHSLGAARAAVDRALVGVELGAVDRIWEGEVDDMDESGVIMAGALGLAVILSYMLMAALFNSMLLPLTIMVSIPMALVGGLLGLIYSGSTMNIASMIGIVMLVGLVSKNAILLVDYTNTLRATGTPRTEALLSAGPVRLRPILMTTISTVIAMTPVALQIGRASEMRSSMAVVVIGGLLLSTLLTLVVIPVMYTYFDDFGSLVTRAWTRRFSPGSPVAAAPAAPLHGHTREREPREAPLETS